MIDRSFWALEPADFLPFGNWFWFWFFSNRRIRVIFALNEVLYKFEGKNEALGFVNHDSLFVYTSYQKSSAVKDKIVIGKIRSTVTKPTLILCVDPYWHFLPRTEKIRGGSGWNFGIGVQDRFCDRTPKVGSLFPRTVPIHEGVRGPDQEGHEVYKIECRSSWDWKIIGSAANQICLLSVGYVRGKAWNQRECITIFQVCVRLRLRNGVRDHWEVCWLSLHGLAFLANTWNACIKSRLFI